MVKKIIFQKEPIDQQAMLKDIGSGEDGCIVSFIGMPRNKSNDKMVLHLEYEIYESMAYKEIEKIIDTTMQSWPVTDCIVVHRYGRVNIKEASVLIALSSPHRMEAYEASRYIIDMLKKNVPIWKKEVYSDGTTWVSERI